MAADYRTPAPTPTPSSTPLHRGVHCHIEAVKKKDTSGVAALNSVASSFHLRSSPVLFPVALHSQGLDSDLNLKQSPRIRESFRGYLSSWPAYSTTQAILQRRKPCTPSEPSYSSYNERSASVVSKPPYLLRLENHLRKELQSLDLTQGNTQELRLQPYREVFEFFIEDFTTYKPLLSAIKNEYEITLAQQREKIRSMEPMHAVLISMSETCNQKILSIRDEERKEIKTMKKEKLHLLKYIDKMKEEKIALEIQVNKLKNELAEQYMQYRNEYDARKLLISDLNDIKQQLEDEESKPATVNSNNDNHYLIAYPFYGIPPNRVIQPNTLSILNVLLNAGTFQIFCRCKLYACL